MELIETQKDLSRFIRLLEIYKLDKTVKEKNYPNAVMWVSVWQRMIQWAVNKQHKIDLKKIKRNINKSNRASYIKAYRNKNKMAKNSHKLHKA